MLLGRVLPLMAAFYVDPKDRAEDEPCERNTVGCCVLHGTDDDDCEAW
jgi:hypothetical protein